MPSSRVAAGSCSSPTSAASIAATRCANASNRRVAIVARLAISSSIRGAANSASSWLRFARIATRFSSSAERVEEAGPARRVRASASARALREPRLDRGEELLQALAERGQLEIREPEDPVHAPRARLAED